MDFINYQTQIKILKGSMEEKYENVEMCSNEVEGWRTELNKEKIEHFNALQNYSALEFKLKKLTEPVDNNDGKVETKEVK